MEPPSNNSEEIDLLHYFKLLIGGLHKINRAIYDYFFFLFRNIKIFILIFAVLAALSFSARYFLPKYFKTEAVFLSHNMSSDLYLLMVNDLDKLAHEGHNTESLSEQLKINFNEAASIYSISSKPLSNLDFTYKNDTTSVSAFSITLVLKDVAGLAPIENGIKNYLENNAYGLKKKEARRRMFQLKKHNLIMQNLTLDSLKEIMHARMLPRGSAQAISMEEPVAPVIQMYKIQQDNLSEQINIDREISMIENIEIVQPFTKLNHYNLPDIRRIFLYSLLASFFLSLISTTISGTRK